MAFVVLLLWGWVQPLPSSSWNSHQIGFSVRSTCEYWRCYLPLSSVARVLFSRLVIRLPCCVDEPLGTRIGQDLLVLENISPPKSTSSENSCNAKFDYFYEDRRLLGGSVLGATLLSTDPRYKVQRFAAWVEVSLGNCWFPPARASQKMIVCGVGREDSPEH